jgi:hypothetical protein
MFKPLNAEESRELDHLRKLLFPAGPFNFKLKDPAIRDQVLRFDDLVKRAMCLGRVSFGNRYYFGRKFIMH